MRQIVRALGMVAMLAATGAQAQEAECAIDPDWKQSKISETLEACKNKSAEVAPAAVAEDLSAYAEVAKGVAEAIGIAAREVGVAVDEFVKTDAGKLTVALIVWHVAGDEILGITLGVPGIFFSIWLWFAVTRYIRHTGEYQTIKGRFGREKSVPILRAVKDFDGPDGFSFLVASVFCAVLIVICIANIFG